MVTSCLVSCFLSYPCLPFSCFLFYCSFRCISFPLQPSPLHNFYIPSSWILIHPLPFFCSLLTPLFPFFPLLTSLITLVLCFFHFFLVNASSLKLIISLPLFHVSFPLIVSYPHLIHNLFLVFLFYTIFFTPCSFSLDEGIQGSKVH